jgi:hypothetical protein
LEFLSRYLSRWWFLPERDGYYAFSRVDRQARFEQKTGDRLDAVEAALHGIQRSQVSALLDSAFREAKSGQKENANEHIQQTADALQALVKGHVQAPESFFQSVVGKLDQLRPLPIGDTELHQVSLKLAEYRSSLNPAPRLPEKRAELPYNWQVEAPVTTAAVYPVLTTINFSPPKPVIVNGGGAAFDARGMHTGQEIAVVATRSLEQNPVTVRNLILIGATQTLDYITWENVTFVGTHIKFNGGATRLTNVQFVNCTFELPNNNAGGQIAEYAALQPKETIKVG